MSPPFRPGASIAIREVWRGRVFEARPTIVVEDDPGRTMLLLPGGVRCGIPIGADGRELRLPDRPWRLEVRPRGERPILSFAWPDTPYSVLLWTAEEDRRVWYVNLQDPLTRSAIGFDTVDHALDVVVELDRSSWRWKDEDELAEAVDRGLFTPAEASDFRDWGERAVERILSMEPPFDRSWDTWRPDPAWGVPELPEGWDHL
ncbi:MAG TPA: DUF402 domain-containing protein [Actinomycetota bacterium]